MLQHHSAVWRLLLLVAFPSVTLRANAQTKKTPGFSESGLGRAGRCVTGTAALHIEVNREKLCSYGTRLLREPQNL